MVKSSLFYYESVSASQLLRAVRDAGQHYPAVKAEGYARKQSEVSPERVLTAMWSDQHYGSDLDRREHLRPYSNKEEARATAKVLHNILDYKKDKRAQTGLALDFLGDDFAGLLGHDDRAVAPLTFQMLRTAHLESQIIAHCAAQFKSVTVNFLPGNHGRNLLRHKARADNAKWDNFETLTHELVRATCRSLKNVRWGVHRRAWAAVTVLGHKKFLTHGDTKLNSKPGSPNFEKDVAKINSSPYYPGPFDIFELGHWHSGQQFSVNHAEVFVNPCLIPPDGFGESGNYLTACGQFMFETTKAYAVGDIRKVRVSPEDYQDTGLDGLVSPWTESLLFTDEG